MTTTEFIQNVNDSLRALDDDVPTTGTDEWNYWLRVAHRLKNKMYRDTKHVWTSSYAVAELGSVSASSEPAFELEDEYLASANYAYVLDGDGHRTDFRIIKPEEKNFHHQEVFIAGQDPQTLYFSNEITTGQGIIGGTLYLPGYFMPDDFYGDNDTIPVDDAYWLVMATAAEIAFNDLTYEDKFADLNAKANELWTQMVSNNRRGTYDNSRITPTNVRRIRDTRR